MLYEITTYIESLRNKGLRPRTLSHYKYVLTTLNTYLTNNAGIEGGDIPVAEISMTMLNEYGAKQRADGLTPNARNNYTAIIRSFFRFLHDARLIDKNPSVALQYVKSYPMPAREDTADDADDDAESDPKYTVADIQTLLASLNRRRQTQNIVRDKAILALLLASSLRAFEVCSLNVSDAADIPKGRVRCVKKGSDRKSLVTVGEFCIPFIQKYLELRGKCAPGDPLFVSQKRDPLTGKPNRMTPNALWKSFATKQREANTKTGLHCFRAASLTEVNRAGGIAAARDFARHKRADITAGHYLKSTAAERREAINTSDVAAIFTQ